MSDNVGRIKIYTVNKSTQCVLQTATVTAVDMISNIGGTLGLFSGMSILSAVELLYWVGKYLSKKLGRGKEKILAI